MAMNNHMNMNITRRELKAMIMECYKEYIEESTDVEKFDINSDPDIKEFIMRELEKQQAVFNKKLKALEKEKDEQIKELNERIDKLDRLV